MQSIPRRDDTIAAPATPPGRGGIAVIRISGPQALHAASRIFNGTAPLDSPPRSMRYGHVVRPDDGAVLDEVLAVYMPGPHSYTAEDTVEIHCHGGNAAVHAILDILAACEVRYAEAGEFTRRAFLNGRIDLVQAESVMEIIDAESTAHLSSAERLMDGRFSASIESLLEGIDSILIDTDADIDFHDSDGAVISSEIEARLDSLLSQLSTMIESYRSGTIIRRGIRIVIAGEANAGKSSLFNTILGRPRALVHTRPGTTRDFIEERILLGDLTATLVDTAGMRHADDDIERAGIGETVRLFNQADIIVLLTPPGQATRGDTFDIPETGATVLPVYSKADQWTPPQQDTMVSVSSTTGQGVPELMNRLKDIASSMTLPGDTAGSVLLPRHHEELIAAHTALKHARGEYLRNSGMLELIADDVRIAGRHLGRILGRIVEPDILDSIFSHFCIGK